MGYKNLIDTHLHTANSFDGNHSAMRMCEAAVKKSIRSVTFTDHCETDIYEKGNFGVAMTHAFVEAAKAKSAFVGTLLVNNGIELGQPSYDIETAEKIIARYDYDQVIGSIHNLRDRTDFYYVDEYINKDIDAILNEYFDEILKMIEWGNFDILAHLDYPIRYIVGVKKYPLDFSKFSGKVDEILKLLAEKNKALEINTSGLFMDMRDTLPNISFVKRFKELGGKYITVGSDSHYAEKICQGIETGYDIARKCGFDSVVIFEKRQPILLPLE